MTINEAKEEVAIEEAIKHEEEIVIENLKKIRGRNASDPITIICGEYADNHRQLAEWLKDYKRLLEQEKWIPVSERLPEENDYRPCTNHEWTDGAVLYCTDKGIVGLGWYYHSTKCWANLDDRWIEQDGQVIAWMPLPEPYKGESEEET